MPQVYNDGKATARPGLHHEAAAEGSIGNFWIYDWLANDGITGNAPMLVYPFTRPPESPQMVGITLFVAATIALTGTTFGQCGSTIQVEEDETLSDLAERCQTTEARILDLNPKIEGSKDLRAGMNLILAAPSAGEAAAKAREAADSLFARLKSYAQDAGRSIERATETASQSLEEFIQQNPDLHQRVRKLGQRLNIPGMEKVEAQVSLSVRKGAAGTPVTLSVIGLPSGKRVEIAGGSPGSDYQIIESARTSTEGTLQFTVQLPTWADPSSTSCS